MEKIILMGIVLFFVSCSDRLSVFQEYEFTLEVMPVPKKALKGETVEIRCRLIKNGDYSGTKFFIRYFQTDGKGILKLQNRKLLPNDLYKLNSEIFRLYYTSESNEQQVFDIYIEDNFGQVIQKNFSFTGGSNQQNND